MSKILAPAKINLYLHITGRRADGYHELESFVAFTDVCDVIRLSHADDVLLELSGNFADGVPVDESNIVIKAARALAQYSQQKGLGAHIVLEKNIPSGAGLGGGSADAAATLCGLNDMWQLNIPPAELAAIGLALGADVPVCLEGRAAHMLGIGEDIRPVTSMPSLAVVLVNCGKSLPTQQVYRDYDQKFSTLKPLQSVFDEAGLLSYLSQKQNDLHLSAVSCVPEINTVLEALSQQQACVLSRMSGSGVTCFGVFTDADKARQAADALQAGHPHWWVIPTALQG